jgi:hypothetical protein
VVAIGALAAVLYGILQPSPTNPRTPLLNFDLAMVCQNSMPVPFLKTSVHLSMKSNSSRIKLDGYPVYGRQVLVPSMLFGISIGVVLCPLSPEWVQTALLSVLLMAVTHKTFSQGVTKWRQEQLGRAYVFAPIIGYLFVNQAVLDVADVHPEAVVTDS